MDNFKKIEESYLKQILFASLKLPTIDKKKSVSAIELISEDHWIYNEYRGAWMLPIRTKRAVGNKIDLITSGSNDDNSAYSWTTFCPLEISDYFDKFIFSWIPTDVRVVILKTMPNDANLEHIDCLPDEEDGFQLKLRYVLQGSTDTLYYLTENENLFIPRTEDPFLIDGSWPHGMINTSHVIKYTICLGSPWNGSENYPQIDRVVLKAGYKKIKNFQKYYISY
jgi:hypothetical protein